jgi:cytochrome c biogenesis protein CcmG/thiol:disulfide interchange protein DsbE
MQNQARDGETQSAGTPHWSGLVVLPFIMFAALAVMFAFALRTGDPSKLPSALIGKPAPEMSLPPLEGLREGGTEVLGFSTAELRRGDVTAVNFFASWCAPCAQEHPLLQALKEQAGIRIYGVNYKDPPPGGRRFIGRYGNPYAAVGVDANGRAAIDWGVYGMPETFIVDGEGRIIWKQVGPITPEALKNQIIPAINAARAKAEKASRSG